VIWYWSFGGRTAADTCAAAQTSATIDPAASARTGLFMCPIIL
jgi:hypothetical protein